MQAAPRSTAAKEVGHWPSGVATQVESPESGAATDHVELGPEPHVAMVLQPTTGLDPYSQTTALAKQKPPGSGGWARHALLAGAAGHIPVPQGRDYRIAMWLRTAPLDRCCIRIAGRRSRSRVREGYTSFPGSAVQRRGTRWPVRGRRAHRHQASPASTARRSRSPSCCRSRGRSIRIHKRGHSGNTRHPRGGARPDRRSRRLVRPTRRPGTLASRHPEARRPRSRSGRNRPGTPCRGAAEPADSPSGLPRAPACSGPGTSRSRATRAIAGGFVRTRSGLPDSRNRDSPARTPARLHTRPAWSRGPGTRASTEDTHREPPDGKRLSRHRGPRSPTSRAHRSRACRIRRGSSNRIRTRHPRRCRASPVRGKTANTRPPRLRPRRVAPARARRRHSRRPHRRHPRSTARTGARRRPCRRRNRARTIRRMRMPPSRAHRLEERSSRTRASALESERPGLGCTVQTG